MHVCIYIYPINIPLEPRMQSITSIIHWLCLLYGGFLKSGYPQFSSILVGLFIINIYNHPAVVNGNFRILNWRYLPYIRPIKGLSQQNMARNMVQYLHFRILKFPSSYWETSIWCLAGDPKRHQGPCGQPEFLAETDAECIAMVIGTWWVIEV